MEAEKAFTPNQIDADTQNQDDGEHCQKDKVQHECAARGQKSAAGQLSQYHDNIIF